MDEELTPLDCLLPSGTGLLTHIPLAQTHIHTYTQSIKYAGPCIDTYDMYTHKPHLCVGHPDTDDQYAANQNMHLHHCHTCLPPSASSLALTHTNSHGGIETQKQITGTFMYLCMRCTSLCLFC